jgi:hypothetical protein
MAAATTRIRPTFGMINPGLAFRLEWERAGGGGWDGGFCTQHDTINEALAAVTVATGGTVKWSS